MSERNPDALLGSEEEAVAKVKGVQAKTAGLATEVKVPVYAFPSRARCPRCQGTHTEQRSTAGELQYRRCMAPMCRHAFKVYGSPI